MNKRETFPHKEVTGKFGISILDQGYNKFEEAVHYHPQKGGWIKYEKRGRAWVAERKAWILRGRNNASKSWLHSLDCHAFVYPWQSKESYQKQ